MNKDKEDDMRSVCFVCNIERHEFDRHAKGFDHHIKNDHNMWQYLHLMIYLREKDPNEYNGLEQYVSDKMRNDADISFLPVNKAIALRKLKEREAAEGKQQLEQIGYADGRDR